MAQQVFEQLEFTYRQVDDVLTARDLARDQIDIEIADRQARRLRRTAAADERANARNQLGKGEWLDEVVVGAAVEAGDAVLERVARGQYQNGRLQSAGTNRAQNLQAVPPGETEIEKHGIERFGVDPKERRFARAFHDHVVLFSLEPLAQSVGDLLLVLDDQDSHLVRRI